MPPAKVGARAKGPDRRSLELILERTQDDLKQMNVRQALAPVTVGPARKQTFRTIYFDTPDLRLRDARVSLRVRSNGKTWVQMLSCRTAPADGISNPNELEMGVSRPEPDLDALRHSGLGRQVRRLLNGALLKAVFEVEATEMTHRLQTRDGDFELTLDDGRVCAGEQEARVREARIAVKSGDPACLLEMASKLVEGTSLRFSTSSTADLGYDLIAPRSSGRDRPTKPGTVALGKKATCADALLAIVRTAEQQIQASRLVVLNSDDPEGPHQLRVGLRRLRTALLAFRSLVDLPSIRELNNHAKSLAAIVGDLRDADVLVDTIFAPVAGRLPDHPGLPYLRGALTRHRDTKRDAARAALQGRQWSALQLYLSLWPYMIKDYPPLQRRVAHYANKAVGRAWNKAAKRGGQIGELSEAERHEMRKALKKFRYTIDFFGSLYRPDAARPFTKRLKDLQDTFGYLNDVAQARQLGTVVDTYCHDNVACQRLAGYTLGWHEAQAAASWDTIERTWDRLAAERPFWR